MAPTVLLMISDGKVPTTDSKLTAAHVPNVVPAPATPVALYSMSTGLSGKKGLPVHSS